MLRKKKSERVREIGPYPKINREAKDSSFTLIFRDKKNVREALKSLHPEIKNVRLSDISIETIELIFARGAHNDLGFLFKNRCCILIEAQSTWSPNIAVRMLIYYAMTLDKFIKMPQETPAFRQGRNEARGRATHTHIRRCVKAVGSISN